MPPRCWRKAVSPTRNPSGVHYTQNNQENENATQEELAANGDRTQDITKADSSCVLTGIREVPGCCYHKPHQVQCQNKGVELRVFVSKTPFSSMFITYHLAIGVVPNPEFDPFADRLRECALGSFLQYWNNIGTKAVVFNCVAFFSIYLFFVDRAGCGAILASRGGSDGSHRS